MPIIRSDLMIGVPALKQPLQTWPSNIHSIKMKGLWGWEGFHQYCAAPKRLFHHPRLNIGSTRMTARSLNFKKYSIHIHPKYIVGVIFYFFLWRNLHLKKGKLDVKVFFLVWRCVSVPNWDFMKMISWQKRIHFMQLLLLGFHFSLQL